MSTRNKPRNEARYTNRKVQAVTVTIETAGSECAAAISADLCDISRGGARLVLQEPLQMQQALVLNLHSLELQLELAVSAEVCWVQPAPQGKWYLGCAFNPELPQENLDSLFANGVLERRTAVRQTRRLSVMMQWELETTANPAVLWDVSEGGFCLLSPLPRKTGRRVLVCVEHGGQKFEIPARTAWELQVGDGYVVGCQFLNKTGYALLGDAEPEAEGNSRVGNEERRTSVWKALRATTDALFKRRIPASSNDG